MNVKSLEIEDFLIKNLFKGFSRIRETEFCVVEAGGDSIVMDSVSFTFQIIVLCTAGNCISTVGHHTFPTASGSLSIIPPNSKISMRNFSKDFKAYFLLFKPDFVKKGFVKSEIMEELLHVSPDYAPIFDLNQEDFSDTLYKIMKIKEETEKQSPFCIEVSRLYILQILYNYNRVCELCLISSDKLINRQYQVLYQYRKLTDKHFITMKTVKEYAGLMNISSKYLSECVKNQTGAAALSIIQNRIIIEAEQLLKYSKLNIKSISYQLGFGSTDSFSRFFKGLKGISPADFRRKP